MKAALLTLLVLLAVPLMGAGGDGCPPAVAEVDVVEDAFTRSGSEPLSDGPCAPEDSCPTGECCLLCVSCCKPATRSSAAHVVVVAGPSPALLRAASPLYAAESGCSVWHPPRG